MEVVIKTVADLQAELDRLDDGVLKQGSHQAGGRDFCALEFESQVRKREWSDRPITLPDIRPLNDAFLDDKARTDALLPVMVALWNWKEWTQARRQKWSELVAIETVKQIISELPNIPVAIRRQCKAVVTVSDAAHAACAAYAADAAADAAAYAAYAADAAYAAAAADAAAYAVDAADAAAYAAYAAAATYAAAARHKILNLACKIWLDAAKTTEGL